MQDIDGSEVYFHALNVISDKSDYHEKVYANWKYKERQIWVYFSEWKKEWQTPEFLLWIVNHESLHGVIDDIMDEEKLWSRYPDGVWTGFPFICGMDQVYDCSTFDLHFLPKIQSKGEYVLTSCSGRQTILSKSFAEKILSTVLTRK